VQKPVQKPSAESTAAGQARQFPTPSIHGIFQTIILSTILAGSLPSSAALGDLCGYSVFELRRAQTFCLGKIIFGQNDFQSWAYTLRVSNTKVAATRLILAVPAFGLPVLACSHSSLGHCLSLRPSAISAVILLLNRGGRRERRARFWPLRDSWTEAGVLFVIGTFVFGTLSSSTISAVNIAREAGAGLAARRTAGHVLSRARTTVIGRPLLSRAVEQGVASVPR